MTSRLHVAVIGAGAFGGWTALYLLRGGARVTLLDAWGPGNSRSSSGGETRVIRGAYGPDQPYTKLAARALELWKENQAQWKRKFFFPIGVLWMVEGDGAFERGSLPFLKDAGIPFEELAAKELDAPLAANQFRKRRVGHLRTAKADTCWRAHRRKPWSIISSPKAASIARQRLLHELTAQSLQVETAAGGLQALPLCDGHD